MLPTDTTQQIALTVMDVLLGELTSLVLLVAGRFIEKICRSFFKVMVLKKKMYVQSPFFSMIVIQNAE